MDLYSRQELRAQVLVILRCPPDIDRFTGDSIAPGMDDAAVVLQMGYSLKPVQSYELQSFHNALS